MNAAPHLQREIPSHLRAVDELCRELSYWLCRHGLATARFAVELVARECLNNAVLHGNRGDQNKRVQLGVGCGRRWISLRVRDQGAGFRWRAAARNVPGQEQTSGRGLTIARLYADRVRFNRRGNQITLWLPKPLTKESS